MKRKTSTMFCCPGLSSDLIYVLSFSSQGIAPPPNYINNSLTPTHSQDNPPKCFGLNYSWAKPRILSRNEAREFSCVPAVL